MESITFYTRSGCHLCEDGLWILEMALEDSQLTVEVVDISTDTNLEAQYGERIPVLRCERLETELDWPFMPESISAWLNSK